VDDAHGGDFAPRRGHCIVRVLRFAAQAHAVAADVAAEEEEAVIAGGQVANRSRQGLVGRRVRDVGTRDDAAARDGVCRPWSERERAQVLVEVLVEGRQAAGCVAVVYPEAVQFGQEGCHQFVYAGSVAVRQRHAEDG
jgi:hypothetical protein